MTQVEKKRLLTEFRNEVVGIKGAHAFRSGIAKTIKKYEEKGIDRRELIKKIKDRPGAVVARLSLASPLEHSAEKNLVLAVIGQAAEDIDRGKPDETEKAWRFINGQWFDYYCGLLELEAPYARQVVLDLMDTESKEAA